MKLAQEGQKATSSFRTTNSIKSFQDFENTAKGAVNGVSNAYLKLTSVQKAHRDAMVDQERASLNLIKAEKASTLETEKLKIKRQELIKATKQQAKEELGLISAYDKIVAKMNVAGKTVQNLNARRLAGERLSNKEQQELRQSTQEFAKYQKAVLGADASIGRFQRNVGNYPKGLMAAGSAVRNLAAAFGLVGGIQLFAQVLTNAFNRIKEFNSGLLNVSKTTGIAGKDLTALSDDIIKLSNELGTVGTESLLQYATVAGQLGVKGSQNILAFSEALAKLETASDVSGEEGGANIARLLTLTDGGVENIKEFGDELVNLGNNFAASENEILGNATAIAQNTGVYKLGRQEALAYAVATKAVGLESELTGSTIGRTLGIIEKAIRTNEGLEQITELTGIAQKDLAQAFKESSGDVLTKLITGLNKVDKAGGSVNGQLEELGITAIRDQRVIATLATGGFDTLAQSMIDVANASGSLDTEFDTASTKLVNQINRIGIAWDNFVLNIEDGQGFLGSFAKQSADQFVENFDRINVVFNENISFVDRWKTAINLNVSTLTGQWIQPFKDSTAVLVANTKAINDNTEQINKQNQAFIETYDSLGPLTEAQIKLNEATEDYYYLLDNRPDTETEDTGNRTVAFLKEQIKAQQDLLELTTNRDDAKVIQDRINAYQKEIDAILGVNKARQAGINAIKGSLQFLEQEVALLKEKQSKLAANTKEYFDFEKKVRTAEKAVKDFKDNVALLLTELDGVNAGLKQVGNEAEAIKNIFDIIGDPDFGKLEGFDYEKANEELSKFSDGLKKSASEMLKLINATDDFMDSFSSNFLSDFGLGSFDKFLDGTFNKLLEGAETAEEKFGVYFNSIAESAQEAFALISQFGQENFDAQYQRLEQQKNIALQFAGESAGAREEIERQYEEKRGAIQRRQAEAEKKQALFNIAIDTAQAVVSSVAASPTTFGLPFSAFALAVGLAQAAIVNSQTIPAFAEGGISEGGDILVNDAKRSNYKEVIVTPKGDVLRPQKRNTIIAPPRGSEIFKSEQSFMDDLRRLTSIHNIMFDSDLIKQPQIPSVINVDNGLNKEDFERGISSLKSAINEKEGVNIFIDENGNRVYKTKQGKRTEQLNNIIRLKRKIV